MEQIKFRFWNIDKWAYITIGETLTDVALACYSRACINGETFYQYTCKTDKNEVEIFEGDIYKVYFRSGSKTGFMYGTVGKADPGTIIVPEKLEKYEVIGNTKENPELLKII